LRALAAMGRGTIGATSLWLLLLPPKEMRQVILLYQYPCSRGTGIGV
jgi:hypothetical protein